MGDMGTPKTLDNPLPITRGLFLARDEEHATFYAVESIPNSCHDSSSAVRFGDTTGWPATNFGIGVRT